MHTATAVKNVLERAFHRFMLNRLQAEMPDSMHAILQSRRPNIQLKSSLLQTFAARAIEAK